jgi:hypothetical protein
VNVHLPKKKNWYCIESDCGRFYSPANSFAFSNLAHIVDFKIGFSSQYSKIFILDPHFVRTNILWLVGSPAPSCAYLPAASELPQSFSRCRSSAYFFDGRVETVSRRHSLKGGSLKSLDKCLYE